MQPDWHPDELAQVWTLSPDERALLANKTGGTRLGFAVLLKIFQRDGRFPERIVTVSTCTKVFVKFSRLRVTVWRGHREQLSHFLLHRCLPPPILAHLARQVGVSTEAFMDMDWSERTQRYQRAQIREHCGYRTFHASDEPGLVDDLAAHTTTFNPDAEALKLAAYAYLRARQIEPPTPDRLRCLLRTAMRLCEDRLVRYTFARLTVPTCAALDVLVQTDSADEAVEQVTLFPIRSNLADLKQDAGAVKVETVLDEVKKLRQLRALRLPDDLFADTPPRLVTHLRQRAASEKPKGLRRHPPEQRAALLAALCWQRSREITDNLVELLIHIAHRLTVRAEDKVEVELAQHARKVLRKSKLLYQLAKAAKGKPDGTVKEVIFPAVGEQTLDDVIREAEAEGSHERQVRLVTRKSYSHHYRRIVPALLEVLSFGCHNDHHRPVMDALALIDKYRDRKTTVFPAQEDVPLEGVVKADWHDLVLDDKQGGRVNRISYELCFLTTLREKLRCKEVWVRGANRYRDPDQDLPQDFDQQRDAYYMSLSHPRDARAFVNEQRRRLGSGLAALDAALPSSTEVRIVTSKKGKGRISISPLAPQPEGPNITQLTAALVARWPMTTLLDILKETELRVKFTEAFRTLGAREVLDEATLRRRLLLCLHGLGTNAGLRRMTSGGGEDGYDELWHVRRRYITREQLRAAITRVCNAIFASRDPAYWGEATTACASDSKKFGAWDQNLLTEWHARYGGPGVMVYWHVEDRSVCVYSQLKACSSSEVAAMIEGVLRHDTEMDIEKQYVDTHGQSEVGFAFCHLLGFQLLPRLKNLKKQRLYRPNKGEPDKYANLQAVLTRPIQWELIEQQYDELIKFATALRLGTADAESILRRFTRANVQHPTYKALCELGKALKTIFLCDYLRLESLRREIHEGLNVIENWNGANDFILYGKGGEFASNRLEDQEVLMLCLHLLQVSLVYINTLMMQQVLGEPEWHDRLTEADLRALSPLKWQHVNPYGTFTLDMSRRLPLGWMG